VNVTHLWKEVVFNLHIQSAEVPADDPIVSAEIHSRFDLVGGPLIGNVL